MTISTKLRCLHFKGGIYATPKPTVADAGSGEKRWLVCILGKHKITAVVSKRRATADDGRHPLVEARQFGDLCSASSEAAFKEISITLATDLRDLVIEMH
jgi:hypothetical protein